MASFVFFFPNDRLSPTTFSTLYFIGRRRCAHFPLVRCTALNDLPGSGTVSFSYRERLVYISSRSRSCLFIIFYDHYYKIPNFFTQNRPIFKTPSLTGLHRSVPFVSQVYIFIYMCIFIGIQ